MRTITAHFLAAFLCLLFLTAFGSSSVSVGERAPDFALRTLTGENLRLSEYRSEVVVLNFWATWCTKCRDALPALSALYEQYQGAGLQVLAVSVDGASPKVLNLINAARISFPVMPDDDNGTVSRMYDLGSMPMTLLIDREGNVRHIHKGFNKDSGEEIAAAVAELLAE